MITDATLTEWEQEFEFERKHSDFDDRVPLLVAEVRRLRAAITRVVTQEGDNLCWRDIYTELACLVGIEFSTKLMVDADRFIANCRAFDHSLRTGGTYKPAQEARR